MLGMVAGSVLPGRGAWGQDDWDAGKKAAKQPNERMMGMAVMAPADFDRWVSNGKSTDQMRRTLESLLTLQVESAARTCGLSDIQKKKLELAGHGDVKRLARGVEELKEKFREVGQDQKKFNEIAQEVSLLQTKMNSEVFGESSLYRKTLNETLDRDQAARYEQADLERRRFRYEAKIEMFMSSLETRRTATATGEAAAGRNEAPQEVRANGSLRRVVSDADAGGDEVAAPVRRCPVANAEEDPRCVARDRTASAA
jgi:hypothetical protein